MKKMKKILSVVLTLAMVLGMSVTTFAEQNNIIGDNDDKGTITIQGFETVEGKDTDGNTVWNLPTNLKIEAYQIIKAVYANNQTFDDNDEGQDDGSFSGYKVVYDKTTLGVNDDDLVIDIDDTTTPAEGSNDLPEVKINEDQLATIWKYIAKNNKDKQPTDDAYIQPAKTVNVTATNATGYEATNSTSKQTFSVAMSDLPVGSYLLVITGEGKIYNPIVGSIYYDVITNSTNEGTDNELEGGNFNINVTTPWVKVTGNPTVDKNIVVETTTGEAPNQQTTISNSNHGSTDVGKDIKYQVVINPIPDYSGAHPVLNIVDTLSKGLQFKSGTVSVKIYNSTDSLTDANVKPVATLSEKTSDGSANKDFIVSTKSENGNTKLTVDFVVSGKYTLGGDQNAYVGKKAVITYLATLTDDALINQGGNKNDVTLNYTRNSSVNGEDPKGTDTDKTYSYTFDIDGGAIGTHPGSETGGMLTKTDGTTDPETGESTKTPLAGAVFTLYTKDPDAIMNDAAITDKAAALNAAKYTNSTIVSGTNVTFNGEVTSTNEGRLPIRGLAAGTTDEPAVYYLKETKAPVGYSLNAHTFVIKISATYYTETEQRPTGVEAGQLKSWEITIDGETTNTFTVNHTENKVDINTNDEIKNVEIKNTKLASLPSTGGIGTTIFTLGGCAIMILAAALYFISRRKSAK